LKYIEIAVFDRLSVLLADVFGRVDQNQAAVVQEKYIIQYHFHILHLMGRNQNRAFFIDPGQDGLQDVVFGQRVKPADGFIQQLEAGVA